MIRSRRFLMATTRFLTATLISTAASASQLRPIVRDTSYHHDKFNTQPKDILWEFRAYTTSFDGADDNNGDGVSDLWGIPEWVAYELRQTPTNLGRAPRRPRSWITIDSLHTQKIAPDDDSYKNSGHSRGHMCMKYHAWRLGADADWNTRTVLNACPQKQTMNAGVWLGLEEKTGKWADRHGVIWIVCGPVIYNKTVQRWIGDPGEVRVAVPDAFFKIVVKESQTSGLPDVLAFIFPMEGVGAYGSSSTDLTPYLTSVDVIEALTGLDFLTDLDDDTENWVEKVVHTQLWQE